MKTLKLTVFMAVAILLNACDYICFSNERFASHTVLLSFTDAAGNNLVAGLDIEWDERGFSVEVNPELYTYRIIHDNPADEITVSPPNWLNPPVIYAIANRYLIFSTSSRLHGNNACRQPAMSRIITFQLTFPQLFGDDEKREIVTYWRRGRTTRPGVPFSIYRVVFEGWEVEVDGSIANIVIDRD